MAIVKPIPLGQNVSMIRGLSSRTQAMEARRANLGIAVDVTNTSYFFPTGIPFGPWVFPPTWPKITALVGSSGTVFIQTYESIAGASSVNIGIFLDNNQTTPFYTTTGDPNFDVITGITPGWHVFQMAAQCRSTSNGGVSNGYQYMIVWPL